MSPERSHADTPAAAAPRTTGAPGHVLRAVEHAIGRARPDLIGLSHCIHATPEVGFEEHRSAAVVAEFLRRHGFAPTVGVFGLPTALRVQAGAGGPRIAVLAEYDALPEVGHGCGHNVICAAAVGAFLGVSAQLAELGGSVVLLGTPAEENGAGKEVLERAGAFDDVDAVVMVHPFTGPDEVASFTSLAVRDVEATFHGVAAHASSAPHEGRNALDAVVAAYQGVAALRQHIPATDRLHAIITNGGSATNVVPATASLTVEVRSETLDGLVELSARVQNILDGAALASGTRVEARWDPFPAYLPVRSNAVLAARYFTHLSARGRRIVLDPPGLVGGGWSTDLGNVSVRRPSIHPTVSISPKPIVMHTAPFGRQSISPLGDAAVIDSAFGLAATMADYLADPALREAVERDFAAAGGRVDVERLLAAPVSALAAASPDGT
ncbi:M20 family metallopeptidase [Leifsonia shinshuensis]